MASPAFGRQRERRSLRPIARAQSVSDRVLEQLRTAIVSGELAPGQTVQIEEVAAMVGVSRTPVREALPALIHMGLIESKPGNRLTVTELSPAYAQAVYGVRSALESLAVEVTCDTLTDADLRTLRTIGIPDTPAMSADATEMIGPDLSLHDFILDRCPLPFLKSMIEYIRLHRTRLVDLEHSAAPEHRHVARAEHEGIISALEARDGALARQLMQAHLDRVGREVTRLASVQGAAKPENTSTTV